jgi:phage/plasmid-associated DNA primase
LQRAVGYSLTGDTSEEVLFILDGVGANGKSTFLETVRALLGDYAQAAPEELLEDKQRRVRRQMKHAYRASALSPLWRQRRVDASESGASNSL